MTFLNYDILYELMSYTECDDGLKIIECTGYVGLGGIKFQRRLFEHYMKKKEFESCSRIFERHPHVLNQNNHGSWIFYIFEFGNMNIINMLFEHEHFDPNALFRGHWYHPIEYVTTKGHYELVNRLLQDPRVDPSVNKNSSILFAVSFGHHSIVNRLLEDPRVCPTVECLSIAVYRKDHHVIERLLQYCGSDEVNGLFQEFYFDMNDSDIVRTFLSTPYVDPSFNDNRLLRSCIDVGNFACSEYLLSDPRVDPSIITLTDIGKIYRKGYVRTATRLLEDPRVHHDYNVLLILYRYISYMKNNCLRTIILFDYNNILYIMARVLFFAFVINYFLT